MSPTAMECTNPPMAVKLGENVGLKETRHIGKIRIHPQNPDLLYVAALGHAFGPNEERGVFRSKDGGATWEIYPISQ